MNTLLKRIEIRTITAFVFFALLVCANQAYSQNSRTKDKIIRIDGSTILTKNFRFYQDYISYAEINVRGTQKINLTDVKAIIYENGGTMTLKDDFRQDPLVRKAYFKDPLNTGSNLYKQSYKTRLAASRLQDSTNATNFFTSAEGDKVNLVSTTILNGKRFAIANKEKINVHYFDHKGRSVEQKGHFQILNDYTLQINSDTILFSELNYIEARKYPLAQTIAGFGVVGMGLGTSITSIAYASNMGSEDMAKALGQVFLGVAAIAGVGVMVGATFGVILLKRDAMIKGRHTIAVEEIPLN